ncbi:MAG TPA: Gfo/Idh/MocA family oxidoreductase [Candidatus Limnocylindria bacterium]|nr:Gfo/Idh/MocA family oxidoreductase [Candidatus Limnocylindria bacterium]
MGREGMTYAPKGKASPVVKPGEFVFSAVALDHGHIYGMCAGLTEAGATLKYVWDPDPKKVEAFLREFPRARPARSEEEALSDRETQLVASAAVPADRCALGLRVMDAGKDYFTDKAPMTTLAQLEEARAGVARTGRKYMVYYSERLHVEGAVYAGDLIDAGEIGKVVQVLGLGPHRLSPEIRPPWFFEKERYGGILCDIGSHQVEQFLYYARARDAVVNVSRVGNFANPQYPELEDFGDAMLTGDNGATSYFRVDWFTPDALRTWGDGRLFILGTEGYIEIRKYANLADRSEGGNHVYLVNHREESHADVTGKAGYPFFGRLVTDCLYRTENAMTQEHAFKAAEICLRAQEQALRVDTSRGDFAPGFTLTRP